MSIKQYSFTISGNTPSSKNSRVWTGKFFLPSALTRRWIKNTAHEWINQRRAFLEAIKDFAPPYYIEFTFIRDTKRKFDYINAAQIVQDQMVIHGWIPDDNMEIIKPYFGDFQNDKKNTKVIITILKSKPKHEYHDLQTHTGTSK